MQTMEALSSLGKSASQIAQVEDVKKDDFNRLFLQSDTLQ